jgi:flavin-dependent dehydrogenase
MHDIIIVGAGLAGSGLAAALAARGRDVLLVERDALPRHKVCGEFLSPESQASLTSLGLYEPVARLCPAAMWQARFVARGGRELTMDLPGEAWGLSRYALDAALAEEAQATGATLRRGLATRLEQGAGGYRLWLRPVAGAADAGADELSLRARAVVVACGRNVPNGLRPPTPGQAGRARYVGVKGHYAGVAMPPQVEIYLFPGGYAGLGPVEGGRVNMCLLATVEAFRSAGSRPESMLAAACRLNRALGERMAGARLCAESVCAVANVDTERVPRPWAGAPLCGDAVAMIPPLCGDGMAMALRAAELMASLAESFLAGRLTLHEWEACYQAAWQAEFQGRLRTGRRVQALLNTPGLDSLLLAAGRMLPWAADHLVRATRGAVRAQCPEWLHHGAHGAE